MKNEVKRLVELTAMPKETFERMPETQAKDLRVILESMETEGD
jgi:hypothetical protein